MENTKTAADTSSQPITNSVASKRFMADTLLMALYYVWDAFERSNMVFFLVGDTARKVKANQELEGDGIDVGIRLNEWASGSKRILDSFIGEPLSEENGVALYDHMGIPIRVHIYQDSPEIMSPDTLMYRNEYFRLPNPFNEEIYG